ncbi:MAG TPA: DUF6356 family protein [Magnetospirillaceae bacterium]|nr:DUF6356 family protein [Magnetospirillaceae bacterium]
MFELFTDHPRSVGETYGEHFLFASSFGARMVAGGLACFVHGFLPFLFVRTGSKTVLALHARMSGARTQTQKPAVGMPDPEYLI